MLPGGRALEIADGNDTRFVLKWDDDGGSKNRRRDAISFARLLGRDAGWSVPVFDLVEDAEWLYVRQSLLAGDEPAELTEQLWHQVIELTEATAGLGHDANSDWPTRLVDTLVAEPAEPTVYCSHDLLEKHSDVGRRLIERIEGLGTEINDDDLGGAADLMHWDLHPGNLLVSDGEISGVIDLDNAGPGPRGFDLITFALSSQVITSEQPLARQFLDDARRRVPDALGIAAVAHLILRFSNWALRTGHDAEAKHWIAEGERLLLK